jgi:hypothetical protein
MGSRAPAPGPPERTSRKRPAPRAAERVVAIDAVVTVDPGTPGEEPAETATEPNEGDADVRLLGARSAGPFRAPRLGATTGEVGKVGRVTGVGGAGMFGATAPTTGAAAACTDWRAPPRVEEMPPKTAPPADSGPPAAEDEPGPGASPTASPTAWVVVEPTPTRPLAADPTRLAPAVPPVAIDRTHPNTAPLSTAPRASTSDPTCSRCSDPPSFATVDADLPERCAESLHHFQWYLSTQLPLSARIASWLLQGRGRTRRSRGGFPENTKDAGSALGRAPRGWFRWGPTSPARRSTRPPHRERSVRC